MTTITDKGSHGTYTFFATITRWDGKAGERRFKDYRLHTDRFDTAYKMATLLLLGAADADPAREYEIQQVRQDGTGGIRAEYGWKTSDEYFEGPQSGDRKPAPADRTGE